MRLAIIGASARAAAFSAIAAGHEVVAADLFADEDLQARCNATRMEPRPDAFVEWMADQAVGGWLYTGSFENYPAQVATMEQLHPLFGTGSLALSKLLCIERLARDVRKNGGLFPEILNAEPPRSGGTRWLAKPYLSAGGIGVVDWTPSAKLSRTSYWQKHIAGTAVSAACVAAGGASRLLGITQQLIGTDWVHATKYHYAGSIGPLSVAKDTREQIIRAMSILACSLELVGLFGLDFVVDASGSAWLVDINPRYTASMEIVEKFSGCNMIDVHLEACMRHSMPTPVVASGDRCYGKAYLFAKNRTRFHRPDVDFLADLPAEGTILERHKPICTVFAAAGNLKQVEEQLKQRAKELEGLLYI